MALDTFQRPLRSLRVSVTDRCNFRCDYCMPEKEYTWLPRADILSFEELTRLVTIFTRVGVDRVRITGGEPLLRRDLDSLVALLSSLGLADLAMTTNGTSLPASAVDLVRAGLQRVTISLDTLRPERFRELTSRDALAQTQAGIDAALAAGFKSVKLNTVVMKGVNDDELVDLLDYARRVGAELRFIEYMDVGGATAWSRDQVLTRAEILARLGDHFGEIQTLQTTSAPAQRFRLSDGTVFGVISSTTQPFCGSCDRARVTADGKFFLCLYARDGLDLRALLRSEATDEEIQARIAEVWTNRADRGAEERLRMPRRIPLAQAPELRDDPHLEMHTRGG